MKSHTQAYIATSLGAIGTASLIALRDSWLPISIGIVATVVCFAIALDLHAKNRGRS